MITAKVELKILFSNTLTIVSINVQISHQRCSVKKGVLRNFAKFTGKHLCQSLWICEFCDISTNTFSYRTPLVAASVFWLDTPPLKEKVYILSRGKDSKWKNSRDRNVKGFWKRRIRKHSKKFERGEGRKVFF